MQGKCISIEDEVDFSAEISAYNTIAFCYPIYGSRVPLIMREFATRHTEVLQGKKLIILVTQLIFSGDGARVFTDMFPKNHFDIIYAEHFYMPNNVCNFPLLPRTSKKGTQRCLRMVKIKLDRICKDINSGIVKLHGFSPFSQILGKVQGKSWQGDSASSVAIAGSMEAKAKSGVRIDVDCTVCGLCVATCPMKNLKVDDNKILHKNNCTMCYRCVNLCPHKAITVFFHKKPNWQYKGLY